METELRLREPSGERLWRGRRNGDRRVILPSSTQSLEQVFDFSEEENAIEWKDWRRWGKMQSE